MKAELELDSIFEVCL